MQANVDKKQAFKIAGKAYVLDNREDSKKVRKEFFDQYKDRILEEFQSAFCLLEYNALDQTYNYFIGVELSDEEVINELGFEVREVAESLYLEVPVEDSENLEDCYEYTYEKFFPNKKYFHGLGPDIEFYQYDDVNNRIGNVKLFICLKLNPHAEGEEL